MPFNPADEYGGSSPGRSARGEPFWCYPNIDTLSAVFPLCIYPSTSSLIPVFPASCLHPTAYLERISSPLIFSLLTLLILVITYSNSYWTLVCCSSCANTTPPHSPHPLSPQSTLLPLPSTHLSLLTLLAALPRPSTAPPDQHKSWVSCRSCHRRV